MRQVQFRYALFQPRNSPRTRFDQDDIVFRPHCRHDHSGETGSGSQIEPGRSSTWNMRKKLCAIHHVTTPDFIEAGSRNKILPLILFPQKRDQPLQPGHRGFIAFRQPTKPGQGSALVSNHAARRRA